jgi:hypothetical protein
MSGVLILQLGRLREARNIYESLLGRSFLTEEDKDSLVRGLAKALSAERVAPAGSGRAFVAELVDAVSHPRGGDGLGCGVSDAAGVAKSSELLSWPASADVSLHRQPALWAGSAIPCAAGGTTKLLRDDSTGGTRHVASGNHAAI